MKKTVKRKKMLNLTRETLRDLSTNQLTHVAGGQATSYVSNLIFGCCVARTEAK